MLDCIHILTAIQITSYLALGYQLAFAFVMWQI